MPKSPQMSFAERLSFIIDKTTTCGRLQPDKELIRELCTGCCRDPHVSTQLFRTLCTQLRRPHAQIRLGTVKLLSDLCNPPFLIAHLSDPVDVSVVQTLCKTIRDLVLTHLQDLQMLALGADPDAPHLPPPVSAAKEMQKFVLNFLLDWETQLEQGRFPVRYKSDLGVHIVPDSQALPWIPSNLARGQFKGFLRFLRRGDVTKAMTDSSGLIGVKKLFLDLTNKRSEEEQRLLASQEAEARTAHRNLKRCLARIPTLSDQIEETLTSLASVLELLVPDPFQENDEESVNRDERAGGPTQPDEDARAHGRLFGSSSGMNLGAAGIEIRLPCIPGSSNSEPQLHVPIIRNDTTRVLEESAKEHAKVAREKYEPLLRSWLETLHRSEHTLTDQTLRTQCESYTSRVRNWLLRLNRLTHLFYDRIVFLDVNTDHHQPEPSKRMQDVTDSSDTSDFEDVEPIPAAIHPDAVTSSNIPVRVDTHASSENDVVQAVPSNSMNPNSPTKKIDQWGDQAEDSSTKRCSSPDKLNSVSKKVHPTHLSDVLELPSRSTVVWRANESLHRFWRPIHPDEYEAPPEYMAQAISVSGELDSIPEEVPANSLDIAPSQSETGSGESISDTYSPTIHNTLSCWAPLLSGKLCQRRDPSGRCPIHGRIVKRDPNDGRPVDPKDRELLQTEVAQARQAREAAFVTAAKRQARRRYPGLMDLSKRPNTTYARLKSRVLNKTSLRRVADTLDAQDQRAVAIRFSDNFIHAVKPK